MKMKKIWLLLLCLLIVCGCVHNSGETQEKIPVVYSKHYNITLFGIQKFHPFDSEKYGRIHKRLIKNAGLKKHSFYSPPEVDEKQLLLVHTPEFP